MKNRKMTIRKIVGTGILAALTVVLSFINIPINGTPLNLALLPIAIAAIIYGKTSGLFVGMVNGVIVLMYAAGAYLAINPIATVFLCLLKTGLAGLFAGLIYQLLKNKNEHLGVILATILVPLVNTSIFVVGAVSFFGEIIGDLLAGILTLNFVIEFVINLLLAPSIYYVVKVVKKKYI